MKNPIRYGTLTWESQRDLEVGAKKVQIEEPRIENIPSDEPQSWFFLSMIRNKRAFIIQALEPHLST